MVDAEFVALVSKIEPGASDEAGQISPGNGANQGEYREQKSQRRLRLGQQREVARAVVHSFIEQLDTSHACKQARKRMAAIMLARSEAIKGAEEGLIRGGGNDYAIAAG